MFTLDGEKKMEKLEMMLRLMEIYRWEIKNILDLKNYLGAIGSKFHITLSRPFDEIIKHPWDVVKGEADVIRLIIRDEKENKLAFECPRPYWWERWRKDYIIRQRIYDHYSILREAARLAQEMEKSEKERAFIKEILDEAVNV